MTKNVWPIELSYVRLFLIICSCFLLFSVPFFLYVNFIIGSSSRNPTPVENGVVMGFGTIMGPLSVPLNAIGEIIGSFGRVSPNTHEIFFITGNIMLGFANLITFFGLARQKKWAWFATLLIMGFNLVFASYLMIDRRFVLNNLGLLNLRLSIPIYENYFQSLILIGVSTAILCVMCRYSIRKYFTKEL